MQSINRTINTQKTDRQPYGDEPDLRRDTVMSNSLQWKLSEFVDQCIPPFRCWENLVLVIKPRKYRIIPFIFTNLQRCSIQSTVLQTAFVWWSHNSRCFDDHAWIILTMLWLIILEQSSVRHNTWRTLDFSTGKIWYVMIPRTLECRSNACLRGCFRSPVYLA